MAGLVYDSTYGQASASDTFTGAPVNPAKFINYVSPGAGAVGDLPQQAVLVVLSDSSSLGALMASTAFKALIGSGRLLFATPAIGDAVQLTGDTMVATLSVAAKPSV